MYYSVKLLHTYTHTQYTCPCACMDTLSYTIYKHQRMSKCIAIYIDTHKTSTYTKQYIYPKSHIYTKQYISHSYRMVQGQRNGKCTSPEKKDGVYVVRNDVLVCRCVYREHNSRGGRGCGSVEDGKLPHGTAAVRGGNQICTSRSHKPVIP